MVLEKTIEIPVDNWPGCETPAESKRSNTQK